MATALIVVLGLAFDVPGLLVLPVLAFVAVAVLLLGWPLRAA